MEIFFANGIDKNDMTGENAGAVIDAIAAWISKNYAKEDIYFNIGVMKIYPKRVSDDSDACPTSGGIEVNWTIMENEIHPLMASAMGMTLVGELRRTDKNTLYVYGGYAANEIVKPSGDPRSIKEHAARIGVGYSLTPKEHEALAALASLEKKDVGEYLESVVKRLIKEGRQQKRGAGK